MRFRLLGVSKAGKYAIWHALAFGLAIWLMASGSSNNLFTPIPALILGFPLMYLFALLSAILGEQIDRLSPAAGLLIGIYAFVANSCFWGYMMACIHGWIARSKIGRYFDGE